jgi:hypothetical protein
METLNQKSEVKLTNRDLALAAYSLAELHNMYLRALEEQSYSEEMTKEQMEETIENIRLAHVKFDAILEATTDPAAEQEE